MSLVDLFRHDRELWVKPVFWTFRHLELIGCRFQHFDSYPSMEQTGDDQRPLERQPNERGSEARLIAKSLSPPDKLSALTHILLSEGSILNKRR